MTTRSLSLLVLTLVLGTALMVGWYLEGERAAAAAERAPAGHEQRIEHVWRSYPGAISTRESRAGWGASSSSRPSARSRRGHAPVAASTGPGALETGEAMLFRPGAQR